MKTIGFIGMGNMAQAIASGFIENKVLPGAAMRAYAPNRDKLKINAEKIGFVPADSIEELADTCDTLIMACKPYQVEAVLGQIGERLKGKSLLSIALGWNFARCSETLPAEVKIQFIMPNTPAAIGEGVFLFEKSNTFEPEERMQVMEAFGKLGMVSELPDELMGIGGAITGCGPAFIDLYIEAMADAAVKYGMPRALAYRLVSKTMAGSAMLQLNTGLHPGELKDAVCSPGGSTIKGVTAMESAGFRGACISAIDAIMHPENKK